MLTMKTTRLIERCRQGDADALGELYKAYAQRMRGVCRRYVCDEQAVDDVLHDAFVIIFTSFDRLRDDSKAESWMMSITRNVAAKYKEHLEAVTTVPLEEAAMVSQHSEQPDVKGVPLEDVLRMVERLPEGYGQIFRLSVFEGMSHKEIATMLGIEPHSSSSQLARSKKMLRRMMQHYWGLLLPLLIPLTFFLLKREKPVVRDKEIVVEKLKKEPQEAPAKQPQEPVTAYLPVHHSAIIATDTLRPVIAQPTDSVTQDTLSTTIARNATSPDTVQGREPSDTVQIVPQYNIADLFPAKPVAGTSHDQRWSLQLAYAGHLDDQSRYNQPYTYSPASSEMQSDPGSSPTPTVPGSINNWSDYAMYLANNPNAVSAQARSIIMNIALNNANRPSENRILRTSHHRMPVTWSLALKYKLSSRFGFETGLSYSRLTSDFEIGADGNIIREEQAIHYLGIPMKGIYNMFAGRRWNLYGSLGLTTEIPVHAPLSTSYYLNGSLEAAEKTTIRAPWQWLVGAGLGLQYDLTPAIGLFAEPSLQYYIPTGSNVETYRSEHPFTFSLPLGIRFTW